MEGMNVLFVCTANSCRSQMAEALARYLWGGRVRARSAGTSPRPIDPLTLEVLREAGVDVSGLRPKSLQEVDASECDWVVSLCAEAEESCSAVRGRKGRLHWPVADPARATGSREERLRSFRAARDAIRSRLQEWLEG